MALDKTLHYQTIQQAIQDLLQLSPRVQAPQPIPHQFVGTALDGTLSTLFAPLNSLWLHRPVRQECDDETWKSAMSCLLRGHYLLLHVGCEEALRAITILKEIEVQSATANGARKLVDLIRPFVTSNPEAATALEKLAPPLHPSFQDYLDAVLRSAGLAKGAAANYRKLFLALSVLRNKAAHKNNEVTEHQRQALRNAGFGAHVDQRGAIVLNANLLAPMARRILDFFDEMATALDLPPGPRERISSIEELRGLASE
jgi:hypothetical protein